MNLRFSITFSLFVFSLLKRVSFSTSVLFSLSIGVELLTPAFPKYFLLLASVANIGKQISLACHLATKVRILDLKELFVSFTVKSAIIPLNSLFTHAIGVVHDTPFM